LRSKKAQKAKLTKSAYLFQYLESKNWHQVAILEAGISHLGEMAHWAGLIPTKSWIFTNIETSSSEGFRLKPKAKRKIIPFSVYRLIIYFEDQELVSSK